MICTNCGKGELQELTGTALLICPLCSSKLINPGNWDNLTHKQKKDEMEYLEDKSKNPFRKESPAHEYWRRGYQSREEEVRGLVIALNNVLDNMILGNLPEAHFCAQKAIKPYRASTPEERTGV